MLLLQLWKVSLNLLKVPSITVDRLSTTRNCKKLRLTLSFLKVQSVILSCENFRSLVYYSLYVQ